MHTGAGLGRRASRNKYTGGMWPLEPGIRKDEGVLAEKDVPMARVPGPDKMPAELFRQLPALLGNLPGM